MVVEQLLLKVGLENIPSLQPKQLSNAGVRELVQVLKGVEIRLVPVEDLESDMSIMGTSHDSLPRGCYSSDPLCLEAGDPSDLENGEICDHSYPSEPMDQSDMLGHGVQSTGVQLVMLAWPLVE